MSIHFQTSYPRICEGDVYVQHRSAERELWQAVLLLAVMDAASEARHCTENRNGTRDARRWIEHGGHDFREVCFLAGVDPDAVQDAYFSGRMKANALVGQGQGTHRARHTGGRQADTEVEARVLDVLTDYPKGTALVADRTGLKTDQARKVLYRLRAQGRVRGTQHARALFWVKA